jgi:poly(A)-specific ribonuclease
MGFSLVIEEIINAKKPLIGHNCIYDWLYVYNQFVDKLPETYDEFIKSWNKIFPFTYDNKVLAFNSKAFFKTSLGEVFDKCTSDDKFKHNLKFKFDLKNGCSNYEGTAMLSHYHEAAYDAHMTGVAFAHILKLKEIENIKNGGNSET